MQFNSQIVSYMAEQLVHKAALNGSLKFACDTLKKKCHQDSPTTASSLLIECNKLTSSDQSGESFLTAFGGGVQDERIFKLASELLLSDENSLRKLSAQVLNEAQHLTQLDCVLATLRKIRWKHLRLRVKERVEAEVERLGSAEQERESETSEDEDKDKDKDKDKEKEERLDYVLGVVRDVFTRHKTRVSEQLNEVQKIMSISSDNDLLAHLQ